MPLEILKFQTSEQKEQEHERAHAEEILVHALETLRAGEYNAVVAVLVNTERDVFSVMATPFPKAQVMGYLRLLEHRLLTLKPEEEE